ncbi:integral membrane protein [Mycobacterium terramassiliense]|uniref:Integral membrane protein n=1 Tax=Mycobacterium terramassiliense TaxID=1841859 RepID=A0A2U3NHV0_9MYCO|nr:integral membrane protein [Mycobacterium terramassiliense]
MPDPGWTTNAIPGTPATSGRGAAAAARREPRTRRNPYDRPYERPAPRGSRFDSHDAYEPYEPRRRRATPTGNGSNPTHHPISQVRYRDSGPAEDPGPARRRRAPRGFPAESWEYEG